MTLLVFKTILERFKITGIKAERRERIFVRSHCANSYEFLVFFSFFLEYSMSRSAGHEHAIFQNKHENGRESEIWAMGLNLNL